MLIKNLPDIIVKYRKLILISLLVFLALTISMLGKLEVNIDFDDYYPNGDPELTFYKHVQKELGNNENILILAIRPNTNVLDPVFLSEVSSLTNELESSELIKRVSDITQIKHYHKSPFGTVSFSYLKEDFSPKIKILDRDSFYTKRFYNVPKNILSVYIELEDKLSAEELSTSLSFIKEEVLKNAFLEHHLIGRKYLEVEYKSLVSAELRQSIIFTFLVIIVSLFWVFRSIKGILLPLFTMVLALVMFYGCLAASGRSLNIMSNLFPTIILIVGMSDIIHILSGYDFEKQKGLSTHVSTTHVLYKVGLAIFLTSLTTAIGFLTLCSSSMSAISSFGLEAALAVLVTFVFSILWAPLLLYQFNLEVPKFFKPKRFNWSAISSWIYRMVLDKSKLIWLMSGLILLVSLIGIRNLNLNNLQITNMPINHPLKEDFRFFDKSLGGSRAFELIVSTDEKLGLRKTDKLKNLDRLHNYLDSIPEIADIISPVSWYQLVTRVYHKSKKLTEIENQTVLDRYVNRLPAAFFSNDWMLVNKSETMGRFSGKMKDIGRLKVNELNEKIYSWINEQGFADELKFQITGTDHIIDKGHQHRIENMLYGLLVALFAVSIILALIFRSFMLLLISLVVNIFPLIIVAGVMAYTGIEMRGSVTILFTIGFVIAVDDTIHFISKYKLLKKENLAHNVCIQRSIHEAGRAIITTSIILVGGFLVLLQSQAWDIRMLGILVSLMLATAVLVDLFLLPILLIKFDKE